MSRRDCFTSTSSAQALLCSRYPAHSSQGRFDMEATRLLRHPFALSCAVPRNDRVYKFNASGQSFNPINQGSRQIFVRPLRTTFPPIWRECVALACGLCTRDTLFNYRYSKVAGMHHGHYPLNNILLFDLHVQRLLRSSQ